VEAVMRDFMSVSHEVDLSRWERRPIGERLDELKARIWQYWM
jgi:hypothetical protein